MIEEDAIEATNEVKKLLRDLLTERFKGELEFGPIVVLPRYDHEGDPYLHSYIVFEGDQSKLDSLWRIGLSSRIWPRAEELGYTAIPIQSFVSRSEWPAMKRWLLRHPNDFARYV